MPLSQGKGADIWYEVAGDGPAMIFIHANPFDHDLWLYQSAHFSTWFRTIRIDIRGYGRSSKITTPFSLEDMCDDVLGVMQEAHVARAILCGCSVGSGIAMMLGLKHPEKFDALILVGGNSGSSSRYQRRIEGYRTDLSAYHPQHMRDLVSPAFAASPLGAYLLNIFAERGPRLRGDAVARVFEAGNTTDLTQCLPKMKVPTLVINGELDHSLPAGRRTARLIPGAVHKILPGAGHVCCLEKPADFDRLVIEFLRGQNLMPAL